MQHSLRTEYVVFFGAVTTFTARKHNKCATVI